MTPLARLSFVQGSAINVMKDGLLMGPTVAIPKLLEQAGLSLQDFDFYEIHEAFAAQVLCTLRGLSDDKYCKERLGLKKNLGKINLKKMNVNGGSIALGHPFGATGARIIGQMAKNLSQKKGSRGLLSICASGGNGMAMIMESYE